MVHRISRTLVDLVFFGDRRNSPTRDVLSSPPNGAILLTPPTHASDMRDIRALFEKDTPTAQCQPWCQPVDDHIRWCKCSGCEFAQSGMKIGDTCSAPPARRPRRQGSRGRTSLLCRRKGRDEAAAPEVGRRELEEGDGDHDPDPRREPGAEAAARRLRCVASRRSALDLTR